MELINLKTNSVQKRKFNKLASRPSASEILVGIIINNLWRSLSCEHFPELKIRPKLCLSLRNNIPIQMRASILIHTNDQEQIEVATIRFKFEELTVALSY